MVSLFAVWDGCGPNVLGHGLPEGVTIEKHMADQSHPLRIHQLAGMKSHPGISRYLLGMLPQPVMGIGRYSPVGICEFRHRQTGELLDTGCVQHALALQIVHQSEGAGRRDQWRAEVVWLSRCHVIRPDS